MRISDWSSDVCSADLFSEEAPSRGEVIDALRDLVLESVEVFPDNHVVLGLTDSCGLHFMDGYWPAVRFNGDDGVEIGRASCRERVSVRVDLGGRRTIKKK